VNKHSNRSWKEKLTVTVRVREIEIHQIQSLRASMGRAIQDRTEHISIVPRM
jgi:hypothetical protein